MSAILINNNRFIKNNFKIGYTPCHDYNIDVDYSSITP